MSESTLRPHRWGLTAVTTTLKGFTVSNGESQLENTRHMPGVFLVSSQSGQQSLQWVAWFITNQPFYLAATGETGHQDPLITQLGYRRAPTEFKQRFTVLKLLLFMAIGTGHTTAANTDRL